MDDRRTGRGPDRRGGGADPALPSFLTEVTARPTDPEAAAAPPPGRVLADIRLVAGRNLPKIVHIPGIDYKDFVVPAVLVQTMTFAAMGSGIGIANDLHTGMVDRLRSLPIARSAFLVGGTSSDSLRLTIQATMLTVVACAFRFRFHNGVLSLIGMLVVVVMFGIALTTFSAWVGLTVRDPETVQAAVFVPILPLVFTSSAFAPVSTLPGWMQPTARVSPVTWAINTARGLSLGDDTVYRVSHVHLWTVMLYFGLWWLGIVIVFAALAVRRYRFG